MFVSHLSSASSNATPTLRRKSNVPTRALLASPPEPTQHRTPQFEDRFIFGEVLGSGSFAEVKVATRRDTQEEFAVKILPKQHTSAASGLPAEIENWQRLSNSSHVAKLEDVYEDDTSYHIVQELCYGGDLQSYLERHGALDEKEAAQVMYSALSFLADCHSNSICYGDVKPANFLMKSMYPSIRHLMDPSQPKGSLTVKAADMGSSQQFHPPLKLRRTVGTIMYMAPEMFVRSYGVEVDMWSAGVMMYQLLTGRFPFWDVKAEFVQRLSPDLVTPTIRQGEVVYNNRTWSNISRDAFELVGAMLTKDPAKRITAEQAMAHPWFQHQLGLDHTCAASSAKPTVSSNILPMTALHS